MDTDREDLRLAAQLGYSLLRATDLPGGASVSNGVLSYDPALSDARRAQAVCRAIRLDAYRPQIGATPHGRK